MQYLGKYVLSYLPQLNRTGSCFILSLFSHVIRWEMAGTARSEVIYRPIRSFTANIRRPIIGFPDHPQQISLGGKEVEAFRFLGEISNYTPN